MGGICENCGKEFKSANKRRSCSRSCAVALAWKDPTKSAKRRASIEKARRTPESRARSTEANNRRWAKPGERHKLSMRNKLMWAKPRTRKKLSEAIKRAQGTPERRAFYSRLRVEQWANDPEYRRKTEEGIRRSKGTPEARALWSQLLRERWADPVMRAKYTAANHARNNPEHRERCRQMMLKRWREDADFRALVAASMEVYWSTPGIREWHSARLSKLWSDPIWRTRKVQAIAAGSTQNMPENIRRGIKQTVMDGAVDIMSSVNAVIPKGLPDFMRDDLASDITLALLEGHLKFENLRAEAKSYLTAHRKMFPDKWGPISIDAPLPGTDGFTLADTLSNDSAHF